jgi:N-sulfoglucosamine sulfohydrolase
VKRRILAVAAAVLALAFSSTGVFSQTPAEPKAQKAMHAKRPNILLIVTDDQGAQMGALGTPGLSTPNMDRLAKEGTLFRDVFNAYPSCSPSRASILTGTYPHTHRIRINVPEYFGKAPAAWSANIAKAKPWGGLQVPDGLPTLPETLNRAGYHTGISHKFHILPHAKFPFASWIGGGPDSVKKFIAESGEKPFFLMHNIGAPHRPFRNAIRADALMTPVDPAAVTLPPFLPDVPAARQDWADYLSATQAADAAVGEALRVLRDSGRYDDTLILFTGDNGPAFTRGKASTYPLGVREPLIVAGPGIPRGATTNQLASLVDLMPTILDYAGVARPATMAGISLRPILERRPGAKGHALLVSEYGARPGPGSYRERGAFDGRYHYIRRANTGSAREINADNFDPVPWENRAYGATLAARDRFPLAFALMTEWQSGERSESLFDLKSDPWAIRDVIADPAFADARNRMRAALDRWQAETGDSEMPRSTDQKKQP